jgi:hypothetical protein
MEPAGLKKYKIVWRFCSTKFKIPCKIEKDYSEAKNTGRLLAKLGDFCHKLALGGRKNTHYIHRENKESRKIYAR